MTNTSTKNLILSQPKIGQTGVTPLTPLSHTSTFEGEAQVIRVEIPGVDPAEVDVNCEGNMIQVRCPKGEYSQPIDPTTDISKIKADILWGMLTLVIPMPEPPAARSIKVSIYDAAPEKKAASKTSLRTEKFTETV